MYSMSVSSRILAYNCLRMFMIHAEIPGSTDEPFLFSCPTLQRGWSPLMCAAGDGYTATVEALLSHKAGIDLQKKVLCNYVRGMCCSLVCACTSKCTI